MSTLDRKKDRVILGATETKPETVMDNVQTYDWDSQDTRRALIQARIAECEAQREAAVAIVQECDEALASLTTQLMEIDNG